MLAGKNHLKQIKRLKIMNNNKNIKFQKIGKDLIPGLTQILSKRPDQFAPKIWPAYFKKAKGALIWDIDNNKYLDMSISGIGTVLLGYQDKNIDEFVIKAIKKGNSSSLNCLEEIILADKLCKLHPWAKMARYTRSGGEAVTVAVRIARAYTKKDKLAVCGYHGWHDWYGAANLNSKKSLDGHWLSNYSPIGIPKKLKNTTFTFSYNKIEELEKIFKKNKNQIAAVILETVRDEYPKNNFLNKVKKLCKKNKCLLIFDEISAGFRVCNGGSHLYFNVNPDMAVFAKAISNGYPMGAIIGKKNVMKTAEKTLISSSYWSDRVGPAAAIATIDKIIKKRVVKHINKIGIQMQDGLLDISKKTGLKIIVKGIPGLTAFKFNYKNSNMMMTIFIQYMLKNKILAIYRFYPNYSHNSLHVKRYLNCAKEIFNKIEYFNKKKKLHLLLKYREATPGFSKFKI